MMDKSRVSFASMSFDRLDFVLLGRARKDKKAE